MSTTANDAKPASTEVAVKKEDQAVVYRPHMSKVDLRLTVSAVQNIICVPARNGARCSKTDAIKFMAMCQARGLNPYEGDAFLLGYLDSRTNVVSFNLITAHQAFLKRAETHQDFDGMRSGVIVAGKDGVIIEREGDFYLAGETLLGGWAIVFFKEREVPITRRVKLSTFDTGKSRWSKDPGGMICKVAEADALRSAFPTALGGLYTHEERGEVIDVESRPVREPAGRTGPSTTEIPGIWSGSVDPGEPGVEGGPYEDEPGVDEVPVDEGVDPPASEDASQDAPDSSEALDVESIFNELGLALESASTPAEVSKLQKSALQALPMAHHELVARCCDERRAELPKGKK